MISQGGSDLLICAFASINPITVDIDGLRQIINGCREVLKANAARNASRIARSVHFDIARLFVIAERTVELAV